MQPHPREASPAPGNFKNEPSDSSGRCRLASEELIQVSSSSEEDDSLSSEQLVLNDPHANGTAEIEPIRSQPSPFANLSTRVLPSVGAFTVQCASCFKWRLIPTKEKYEEIREHILQHPFYCQTAREWRPNISCDDPTDISQDGSRIWAIDKPNIAQPPRGWQRLLRIRGEGSTKFADVYYVAPSGKRLRSMVEVQKYLKEYPEYMRNGVTISQFSFQIPKPLQENYVRKCPPRTASYDNHVKRLQPGEGSKGQITTNDANCFAAPKPLAWAGPDDCTDLRFGRSALRLPSPSFEDPESDLVGQPAKKQARRTFTKTDVQGQSGL